MNRVANSDSLSCASTKRATVGNKFHLAVSFSFVYESGFYCNFHFWNRWAGQRMRLTRPYISDWVQVHSNTSLTIEVFYIGPRKNLTWHASRFATCVFLRYRSKLIEWVDETFPMDGLSPTYVTYRTSFNACIQELIPALTQTPSLIGLAYVATSACQLQHVSYIRAAIQICTGSLRVRLSQILWGLLKSSASPLHLRLGFHLRPTFPLVFCGQNFNYIFLLE